MVQSTGRPGAVAAKKIVGYRYSTGVPYVAWPSGTVERSPAAPDRLQIICAKYRIYDWNYTYARWFIWHTVPGDRGACVTVAVGRRLTMAAISRVDGNTFGRYRGVWTINWYANLPTYRRIASLVLDFNDAGDYRCATGGCRVLYMSAQGRHVVNFPG